MVGGYANERGLKERSISAVLHSWQARKRKEAADKVSASLARGPSPASMI